MPSGPEGYRAVVTWWLNGSADIALTPEALHVDAPTLHSPLGGCVSFADDAASDDVEAFLDELRASHPPIPAGDIWEYFDSANVFCWRFGPHGEDAMGCTKGNVGDEHEGWAQSVTLGAALLGSPLVESVDPDGYLFKAPFTFAAEQEVTSPSEDPLCIDDLRTVSAQARADGHLFLTEPALAPPFGASCQFTTATCPFTFEPEPGCHGPTVDLAALRSESIARLQTFFGSDGLDDGVITFQDGWASAEDCYAYDYAHLRYSVPVPAELVPAYFATP